LIEFLAERIPCSHTDKSTERQSSEGSSSKWWWRKRIVYGVDIDGNEVCRQRPKKGSDQKANLVESGTRTSASL
jgi:hypothetical protein